jgi:hypothetical protein
MFDGIYACGLIDGKYELVHKLGFGLRYWLIKPTYANLIHKHKFICLLLRVSADVLQFQGVHTPKFKSH